MSLLHMSVSGAAIIALTVLLRAAFIHKLPKRTFSALWGLALIRLLLPLSLPYKFSVYSLLARLKAAPVRPRYAHTNISAYLGPVRGTAGGYAPEAKSAAPFAGGVEISDILGIVWLCGAVLCAAFFAAAYVKSRREFKTSLPFERDGAGLSVGRGRLSRRVEIRVSDKISAPLTYGVFRPVILMPKNIGRSGGEAVKYMLEHELVHIRRFDAAKKLALTAALCLHWFNPAVWLMYVLANRDMELSCDEAVVRAFGDMSKASYAMTLIRMEEVRSGLYTPGNNFSKNSVEERIIAIMKIKKTSLAAMIAAVCLIIGVTGAFATSADEPEKENRDKPSNAAAAIEDTVMMSYTDDDETVYYSTDSGRSFVPMTDEEFEAVYNSPEVEWWTYDEYAAWLENEKKELNDMIGERCWTGSRGEFVWDRETVDETIATYESILADIGRGVLVSKTVDGSDDIMLSVNPLDMVKSAPAAAEDFAEYEPFGMNWNEEEKTLYYNGKRVRYFLDAADVGNGGVAIKTEYTDREVLGEVDVYAVRQRTYNDDGSYNPMGPLVSLEPYSPEEFDLSQFTPPFLAIDTDNRENSEKLLKLYEPFGLEYRINPFTGEIAMKWQKTAVRSIFDSKIGVYIANSLGGEADEVDLEAVYENGKLTGLKRIEGEQIEAAATEIQCGAEIEGETVAQRMAKYEAYGVRYEENDDGRAIWYEGKKVNTFFDQSPNGGIFSVQSSKGGEINLAAVYDEDGKLTGVKEV